MKQNSRFTYESLQDQDSIKDLLKAISSGISKGKIVASDRPSELTGLLAGGQRIVVEVRGDRHKVSDCLSGIPGVDRVSWDGAGDWHRFTCLCRKGVDLRPRVFQAVAGQGWTLRELRLESTTLEDVFVALTAHENGQAAEGDS